MEKIYYEMKMATDDEDKWHITFRAVNDSRTIIAEEEMEGLSVEERDCVLRLSHVYWKKVMEQV